VADFLRACPPFDALEAPELERLAASTEVEFFLAGSTIFAPRAQAAEHLRVVRTGAVELVQAERVLALVAAGEPFGRPRHASKPAGLPSGFAARARQDTLCYRVPEEPARADEHAPGAGAGAYRHARPPRGRTPWREASYCAVDLELSGLDPKRHEIVSFGAIPIEDGRVRLSGAVHGRVRPQRAISEASIRVHGIRPADLIDAPPLAQALDPLLATMAGRIPVAHVAAIERGFLRPALRSVGLRLRRPMIDTSVLGPVWLRERDGRAPRDTSLGALAQELGLPSHHPHDALGDALTTAQAFIALATHLDARRRESVRSLCSAARRLELLPPYRAR